MGTNLYINNFGASSEQDLINDLTAEVISFYGVDTIYIPRTLVDEDALFGEDTLSAFNSGYEVDMLIETTDAFGGEGDLISKFGYEVKDEITFAVSRTTFEISTGIEAPLAGDLIHFPLSNGLFEIKFVEDENPFYQAGKLYQFKLQCQLFEYSHEDIATGVDPVDAVQKEQAYAVDLTVGTPGSGNFAINEIVYQGASLATATAQAKVASWNAITNVLRITNIVGTFTNAVTITGDTSAAAWTLSAESKFATDIYEDNKVIETEADSILDFTESNPFGEV